MRTGPTWEAQQRLRAERLAQTQQARNKEQARIDGLLKSLWADRRFQELLTLLDRQFEPYTVLMALDPRKPVSAGIAQGLTKAYWTTRDRLARIAAKEQA